MYNCIFIVRFLSMNDAGKVLMVAFYSGVKYLHRVFLNVPCTHMIQKFESKHAKWPPVQIQIQYHNLGGGGKPLRWYFYLYPDM